MRHQHVQTRQVADEALLRAQGTIAGGVSPGLVRKLVIDVPLATLQGETSGTPFGIFTYAVPPTGFQQSLLRSEINVVQALAAAGLAATHVELGNAANNAAFVASTDINGATGLFATPGSNPTISPDGNIELTVTLGGATMAALTAGHIQVNLYFAETTSS